MTVKQNTPFFVILFICTGNMCRSPIAEGIMKKKIEEDMKGDEKEFILVHSCGTYANEGNKPSENAMKISKQNNIDISNIRSKPVNKLMIEESDIIFVLSVEHLNYIHENYFSAKNKTFLLKMFGENRPSQMADSIPDPMGFTIEYYNKTYIEIKNAIDKIFPFIKEMIIKKLQNKT
jgi:protein-tyrosine-phosphatase